MVEAGRSHQKAMRYRQIGTSVVTGANSRAVKLEHCRRVEAATGHWGVGYGEAISEELVEGDFKLGAGLHEPEHGVACDPSLVAASSARDFAFGDEATDVVFRAVGVERDFGVGYNSGVARIMTASSELWLIGETQLRRAMLAENGSTLVANSAVSGAAV